MPCPVPNLSQPRELINSRIHQSSLFNNLGASSISASLLVLWGTVNILPAHALAIMLLLLVLSSTILADFLEVPESRVVILLYWGVHLHKLHWLLILGGWVPLIVWLHWDNLWGILNYLKGYLSCFILNLIIFLLFQISGFSYVCASLYIIFQLKILLNNIWDRVFKRLTTKLNFLRVYKTNPPGNCTLSILCCPILTLWQQHCRK